MNRRRIARSLLAISVLYWAILFGSVLYNALILPNGDAVGYYTLKSGCFLTNHLFIYAECYGFFGAPLAKFVLSLPWIIFQLGYLVFGSESFVEFLVFVPLAMLFWGPLAYPLLHRWLRGRAT